MRRAADAGDKGRFIENKSGRHERAGRKGSGKINLSFSAPADKGAGSFRLGKSGKWFSGRKLRGDAVVAGRNLPRGGGRG